MSPDDIIYPGFGEARKDRGEVRGYKNPTEIETNFPRLSFNAESSRFPAWVPRLLKMTRALVPLETYWDQVVVPRALKQYGVYVVVSAGAQDHAGGRRRAASELCREGTEPRA